MNAGLLIVGSTGLLGTTWVSYTKKKYSVFGSVHERLPRIKDIEYRNINLYDIEEIENLIALAKAQIVVNCVAMTNIEMCEQKPMQALEVNSLFAENLAKACSKKKIKFVHISTDHVFSGRKEKSKEVDPTEPINVYAKTKVFGETGVMKACPTALIIRTNFFGWGTPYRQSFSDVIINALRSSKKIDLFTDVFFTPVLTDTVIKWTHELIEIDANGIYNIACDQRVSKFQFGIELAKTLNLNERLIQPCLLSERTDLAPRPFDLSLCNEKLRSVLGIGKCCVLSELKRLKNLGVDTDLQ